MNKKILYKFTILMIFGFSIQAVTAAPVDTLQNITDQSQQALNNASKMADQTAKGVDQTLDPIQSMQIFDLLPRSEASYGILNSINSILNILNSIMRQIQQIINFRG